MEGFSGRHKTIVCWSMAACMTAQPLVCPVLRAERTMSRVTPFHVCSSKAARLGSELQPAKICHSHGPTSSRESAMAQLSMLVADMHTLRHMTTGSFTALLMADLGPGQPGTRC